MGLMDKLKSLLPKGGGKEPEPDIQIDESLIIEKVRQSDLFKDLPQESLDDMFKHMEKLPVRSGEVLIKEGDEGDYYYVLAAGTAQVTRKLGSDTKPSVVAELLEPTAFGEEALISNAKRNASVTMTGSGVVMRLSKDDFDEFVKEPLLAWFSPVDAQNKVGSGAKWIDVRDTAVAKQSHLHGALSITMQELRERAQELDPATLYICYCENGRQSSTAAFLLRQRGLNVGVLRGGLQSLKRAGIA